MPAAGSGAAGGRRPGHADWPEGQVSRRRRPGGGVRAKVPRRRRARSTRGDWVPLGAGERGAEAPSAAGLGHRALRGSGGPGPAGACAGCDRPAAVAQAAGGTRLGKGRRQRGGGRSARAGGSPRPTAVPACRPRPHPHPAPGPGGCQRRCHGRRLFAGARGRAAATDGAGARGGAPPPGRPPRAALSARQPAPRARASPPYAPLAAKFGSTLRRALTPCPFHLPAGPRRPRRELGGGLSAAPELRTAASGDSDEGTRHARVGAPTLGDPEGGQSPALSSRKPRVGAGPQGRPDLGRLTEQKLSFH